MALISKENYKKHHTPLSTMDISSRQKIIKETLHFMPNEPIRDCRSFNPTAAEYTFSSSAHRMFSRINHMLGHETSP